MSRQSAVAFVRLWSLSAPLNRAPSCYSYLASLKLAFEAGAKLHLQELLQQTNHPGGDLWEISFIYQIGIYTIYFTPTHKRFKEKLNECTRVGKAIAKRTRSEESFCSGIIDFAIVRHPHLDS